MRTQDVRKEELERGKNDPIAIVDVDMSESSAVMLTGNYPTERNKKKKSRCGILSFICDAAKDVLDLITGRQGFDPGVPFPPPTTAPPVGIPDPGAPSPGDGNAPDPSDPSAPDPGDVPDETGGLTKEQALAMIIRIGIVAFKAWVAQTNQDREKIPDDFIVVRGGVNPSFGGGEISGAAGP